jgi:hypothetical protein
VPTEPEIPVLAGELFWIRDEDVPARPTLEPVAELAPETEREGKLRIREGEASPPEDDRMLRPESTRLEATRPDDEFDLKSCEDNRVPVEEKLRPTDLRPSRDRACRAREAISPPAFMAGRRLGWVLRRERLPSCPTRPRSRAAPDSLRF